MLGAKIKIDKDLLKRAKKFAEAAGYSSTEEFITHLIERELSRLEQGGVLARGRAEHSSSPFRVAQPPPRQG